MDDSTVRARARARYARNPEARKARSSARYLALTPEQRKARLLQMRVAAARRQGMTRAEFDARKAQRLADTQARHAAKAQEKATAKAVRDALARERALVRGRRTTKPKRQKNVADLVLMQRLDKRAQRSKGRAKKFFSDGSFTASQLRAVIDSQRWRCAYCRVSILAGEWHVDHKTPLCRGGSNAIENIQAVCAGCGLAKRQLTDVEYRKNLQ